MRNTPPLTQPQSESLLNYFEMKYAADALNLSKTHAGNYRTTFRQLDKYLQHADKTHRGPATLRHLSKGVVLGFMRWIHQTLGRSERTANNKRQTLMSIWNHAARVNKLIEAPPKIPKLEEPVRIVQAWDVEQIARLCESALYARSIKDWTGQHAAALISVIYDTSHRLGAIMQATKDSFDPETGTLLLRAEWTKQKADTVHTLHPTTVLELKALPVSNSPLLFPWPVRRRAIWPYYRAIVKSAGLRATRKDLFHKIRRTSYTYVYALLGEEAAKQHAGHSTNMSAHYLDLQLLAKLRKTPKPIDVLPRPK